MKILNLVSLVLLFVVVSCSTVGKFKIPAGTKLYVDGKLLNDAEVLEYKRKPFFWDTSKGVPYMLEKDGKIVDKGTVKAQFRAVSIFWPPFAIAYWPMGFNKEGYDLTSKFDVKVRPEPTYVEATHRK